MTEVKKMLPMIINNKTDLEMETLLLYLKEKWNRDIYERLRSGYCEMSQINATLAEIGFAEDMLDLEMYEARLGCEVS